MIKLGEIILKGLNWVHNGKISVPNGKISSNGLERSQLGT